ncbi:MAG TPA: DEAD/DEAH box helicase, partial [Longimicrobiales bacterium]
ELAAKIEADVPRPAVKDPEPTDELKDRQEEIANVVALLTDGMPAEPEKGSEQYARWLLAHLLEFHRREKRQFWWDYFRIKGLADEDRYDERKTIVGLEFVGEVPDPKATKRTRAKIFRYRFPEQEQSFDVGDKTKNPRDEKNAGIVVAVDDAANTIDLRRVPNGEHATAIMLDDFVNDKVMRDSLLALGIAVASNVVGEEYRAALDLLYARPRPSAIHAIQGPPGTGKTHTGAHMILEALKAGKRVGVTANSHKVIGNLLTKVCTEAAKLGYTVKGIQRADEDDWCERPEIDCGKNGEVLDALTGGTHRLAAGTAWSWSRPEMIQALDVLFIDEAGQFSLANALAVAPAAKEIVLLGDPQQLDQPLQGVHPPGVAISALGHMLGDHATMPEDGGMFLDKTWRLHPSITAFTSEVFYEHKLTSKPGLELQGVAGNAGLQMVGVEHAGNSNESIEEAERVAQLVASLVDAELQWTDDKGESHPLELKDIVIVAPYNLQVAAIAKRLPGARVGTVDKFQGQEAPISIYSMATSTAADAPRGMRFLYSPNRFNVATSRARCIAVVVASPELFVADCRTPEQMKWANAFCRFAELASAAPSPGSTERSELTV